MTPTPEPRLHHLDPPGTRLHLVDREAHVLEVAVHPPSGPVTRPPVLLHCGLGAQRIDWLPAFVGALTVRGHEVVAFDPRDVGGSSGFDHLPGDTSDLERWRDGEPFRVPYRLTDLRDDALAVLDHLDIDAAHVIGRSMGGMVAQHLAIHAPARVRSLVSFQSTTGAEDAGQPSEAAMEALAAPTPSTRQGVIEAGVERSRITGSPGRVDEAAVRARLAEAYDRAHRPAGKTRQLLAILAEEDRTPALAAVRVPTLILHGDADTLVDVTGGMATAAAIPGARLEIVAGLGHDLPDTLIDPVMRAITGHLDAVDGITD